MSKKTDRDLFDGIADPSSDPQGTEEDGSFAAARLHLHSPEELSALSRPVLLSYTLRLQDAYSQLKGENEFQSWESRDLRSNLTFFAAAVKAAHQLNAADVETIVAVACDDLAAYFDCASSALFFHDAASRHFELCRANTPLVAESLPAGADRFLERLFTSHAEPFVVRYNAPGALEFDEGEESRTEPVREKWFEAFRENALVFPLRVKERAGEGEELLLLGGLVLGAASRPLDARDEDMAVIFCNLLASSLHNARLVQRLNDLTVIDPLTRLYNRRHLADQLATAMLQAHRLGHPLSMAMLDIDHFKRFNDTYGHLCGDEVLQHIGAALKAYTRLGVDTAARYGGEEFVLLMPFTDTAAAVGVAERLRCQIRESAFEFEGRTLSVTASIGVTAYIPGEKMEAFVNRADAALYQAKSAGRDRVRCL